MIWIRRFFIMPLGILLFMILTLLFVSLWISQTFLDPQFYKDQLVKADVYEFMLIELPSSAVDEIRDKDPADFSEILEENPIVMTGLDTGDIVSSLGKVLPQIWIQEQSEQIVDQFGDYIIGEEDGFSITIMTAELVKSAAKEIKALIRTADVDVYDSFFKMIVMPAIEEALAEAEILPFDISLSSHDLLAVARKVATEDWIKDQFDEALDEIVVYLVGEQEYFEIKVQLSERSDVIAEEMKKLLMRIDLSEFLFDVIVDPFMDQNLDSLTDLSFGVYLSQEDIVSALRESAPELWLEEQVSGIMHEVAQYIIGDEDTIRVSVSLVALQEKVIAVTGELAYAKLKDIVVSLPGCNPDQISFQDIDPSETELPACVPSEVDSEDLANNLYIDLIDRVRVAVDTQIPDHLLYSEDHPEELLGIFSNLRGVIEQGWSYTDADLRSDLFESQGEGSAKLLDEVRIALGSGWTYTDVDLRRDLMNAGEQDTLNGLDTFRSQLRRASNSRFLLFVLLALVLIVIGVLGGRNWFSKVTWAAASLGVAAGVLLFASGPVYDSVGQVTIDDLRLEIMQGIDTPTKSLIAEKGLDMLQGVVDDFLAWMWGYSLLLVLGSMVLCAVLLAWSRLSRSVTREGEERI